MSSRLSPPGGPGPDRSRRPRSLVVWGLCALAIASPAVADFARSYDRGVQAARRGNWNEVIAAMQEATAEQPTEQARMRFYGMRIDAYLPHFYLGLAYLRLGDCAGALRAWEVSERQGAVAGRPEAAQIAEGRKSCVSQPVATPTPRAAPPTPPPGPSRAQVEAATSAAQQAIEAAGRAGERAGRLLRDPLLSGRREGGAAVTQLAAAQRQLDTARRRAQRTQSLEDLDAARQGAEQSSAAFAAIEREVTATLAELRAEAAAIARAGEQGRRRDLEQRLDGAARRGRELLALPAAADPGHAEQRRSLESLLRPPPNISHLSLEQLEARAGDLGRALALFEKTLGTATVASPADRLALRPAVEAYFRGDYGGTLGNLDRVALSAPAARAQAELFRAAAEYSLFLLTGGQDDARRRSAAEAVQRCRRLDGSLQPDRRAFPPSFVAFFANPPGTTVSGS